MYVGYFKAVSDSVHDRPWKMILGNIGVYFSSGKFSNYSTKLRLNAIPQIRFTSWPMPVADTFQYVKLTATYTAQGGEEYMTIGNFDYFKQFNILHIEPSLYRYRDIITGLGFQNVIDDVSLVADTTRPMLSPTDFSLGPDTTICLTGYTIGGQPFFLHYWWNTGDTSRLIQVTKSGKYWCTVDFGCSTYTDTVNFNIDTSFKLFHIADTALCAGKPFIARAPKGYAHYNWSNSTTADSAFYYSPGMHWVHVTSLCGQSYTDTFRLVNTPAVTPGININTQPPIVLCSGTPITFVTNNTGGGFNPTYQWYKNGILIPGATSATYSDSLLVHADTLTVAMYSAAGCPVTQPTISNKVGCTVYSVLPTSTLISADPGTTIIPGQSVTFTATPANGGIAPEYLWYLNEAPVLYDQSGAWTVSGLRDGDVVKVRLESNEHCPDPPLVFSSSLTIRANAAGTGSFAALPGVKVYPNPANDFITIEGAEGSALVIHNSLGQRVMQLRLSSNKQMIDIAALPANMYILKLTDKQGNRRSARIWKR
jgi:hypothetical protein